MSQIFCVQDPKMDAELLALRDNIRILIQFLVAYLKCEAPWNVIAFLFFNFADGLRAFGKSVITNVKAEVEQFIGVYVKNGVLNQTVICAVGIFKRSLGAEQKLIAETSSAQINAKVYKPSRASFGRVLHFNKRSSKYGFKHYSVHLLFHSKIT